MACTPLPFDFTDAESSSSSFCFASEEAIVNHACAKKCTPFGFQYKATHGENTKITEVLAMLRLSNTTQGGQNAPAGTDSQTDSAESISDGCASIMSNLLMQFEAQNPPVLDIDRCSLCV